MCPPGYHHNGIIAARWAHDVRLHIVGLHCGVTMYIYI